MCFSQEVDDIATTRVVPIAGGALPQRSFSSGCVYTSFLKTKTSRICVFVESLPGMRNGSSVSV